MSTTQINVAAELAALQRLTVGQLRTRYAEVFGESTRSGNRPHLIKRIIRRMQALRDGGISDRARRRAAELLDESRLRNFAPQPRAGPTTNPLVEVGTIPPSDTRLIPGTVLRRKYENRTLLVRVLSNGFEFDGEFFRLLTAIEEIRIRGDRPPETRCARGGRRVRGVNINCSREEEILCGIVAAACYTACWLLGLRASGRRDGCGA